MAGKAENINHLALYAKACQHPDRAMVPVTLNQSACCPLQPSILPSFPFLRMTGTENMVQTPSSPRPYPGLRQGSAIPRNTRSWISLNSPFQSEPPAVRVVNKY